MSRLLTAEEAQKFKTLLADYQLREDGLAQFNASNFSIIAGPAGGGKDTLREALLQRFPDRYLPILSTTTRPPREGEQDGVTYHFREVEQVEEGLMQHRYFQAELVHDQQISGLELGEIQKLQPEQCGLSILVIEAERKLLLVKPDIKVIFVVPPDVQTLMNRLQDKKLLDDAELKRRLDSARIELEHAISAKHYYCIVSDTIDHVADQAHAYLQNAIIDQSYDTNARYVARQIIDTLSEWS